MSYSRFARTWPGGGDSWYIYHDVSGGLAVMQPSTADRLSRADVKYLADLLMEAYADMEGDEWRQHADGHNTAADELDALLSGDEPITKERVDAINARMARELEPRHQGSAG